MPATEIAAVLQIFVWDSVRIEQLTRSPGVGILRHPHHHDIVRRDNRLNFLHGVRPIRAHSLADRRVHMGFVKNIASHFQAYIESRAIARLSA